MLALQGSLQFLTCDEIFLILWEKRASGSLFMQRGPDEKRLDIKDGKLVAASSNDPREFLGQILIRGGHLSEEAFHRAYRAHKDTGVPMGRILSMTGAVPAEVVRNVLEDKFRETCLGLFSWKEGSFRFTLQRAVEAATDLPVSIPMNELASEAKKRRKDPQEEATSQDNARSVTGWFPTAQASVGREEEEPSDGSAVSAAKEALANGQVERAVELLDKVPPEEHSRETWALKRTAEERLLTSLRDEFLRTKTKPVLGVEKTVVREMPLTPPERYLLYRMNGKMELEALLKITPLRQVDGLRLFKRCLAEGLIRADVDSER